MCSTASRKVSDSDALTLLSLRSARGCSLPPPADTHAWSGDSQSHGLTSVGLARLSGTDFVYTMRKSRVVIGRDSHSNDVDVKIGQSSFVSREHLVIYSKDVTVARPKFFIECLSKNGIFVNDVFHSRDAGALDLPRMCTLSFPSTTMEIMFEVLAGAEQPSDAEQSLSSVETSDIQAPEESQDSQTVSTSVAACTESSALYASPCPSPSGTLSVVNSCPASPSGNTGLEKTFKVPLATSVRHRALSSDGAVPCKRRPSERGGQAELVVNDSGHMKPPFSYAQLIVQGILSCPEKQLTLSGIYAYISTNYPFYRPFDKGWQNAVRHNLSLNRCFVKIARADQDPGKGSFWRIDPSSEERLLQQAYKPRRQRVATCTKAPSSSSNGLPASGTFPSALSVSLDPHSEIIDIDTSGNSLTLQQEVVVSLKSDSNASIPSDSILPSLQVKPSEAGTLTMPQSIVEALPPQRQFVLTASDMATRIDSPALIQQLLQGKLVVGRKLLLPTGSNGKPAVESVTSSAAVGGVQSMKQDISAEANQNGCSPNVPVAVQQLWSKNGEVYVNQAAPENFTQSAASDAAAAQQLLECAEPAAKCIKTDSDASV